MKRFNKYIMPILLVAIGLMFNQCDKDFLETLPVSSISVESYFKTAADAENALVGCYNGIAGQIWNLSVVLQVTSDNNYAGGDNPENFRFDNMIREAPGEYCTNAWNAHYETINRCNNILKFVPEIDDSKLDVGNRRAIIQGEATFLRAFAYFNLVRIWGDVPLTTTPTMSLDPAEINLSRSSVDAVYTQIIADLENSINLLLPANDPSQQAGRATKGAARALLAQVYATIASPDWNQVLTYCNAVIDHDGYQLLADYDHLFDGDHYNNSESIFEFQYQQPNAAQFAYQLWASPSRSGDSWRKFNTPSEDLIQAFDDEGDVIRKNSSIYYEDVGQYWVDPDYGTIVPFMNKWRHPSGWSSEDNWYVIRLAETYLLRAEAENELGNMPGALADLQVIRDRVNLPAKSLSTKEEVSEAILLERRLELAFEFYRWFDLLRAGIAIQTMQALGYTHADEYDVLFPIPQDERNRNPNLTQNPIGN